jgi:hypothetical protein
VQEMFTNLRSPVTAMAENVPSRALLVFQKKAAKLPQFSLVCIFLL